MGGRRQITPRSRYIRGVNLDPQTILLVVLAALLVPVLLGRVLAAEFGRSFAAFASAAIVGIPVALVFGARVGLLAGTWTLALAALASGPDFLRIDAGNKRWWDHFGG